MSTMTVQIADHCEAIRAEAVRLLGKNLALTRDELEASADLLRLEAAKLSGLAKSLPAAVSVRKEGVLADVVPN